MKFILVIQLCSIVASACDNPLTINKPFDSYRDCAIFGYEISSKYLQQMNPDKLNKQQIYTKFYCKEYQSV